MWLHADWTAQRTGREQAHWWSREEGSGPQDLVLGKVKREVGGRRVEREECTDPSRGLFDSLWKVVAKKVYY